METPCACTWTPQTVPTLPLLPPQFHKDHARCCWKLHRVPYASNLFTVRACKVWFVTAVMRPSTCGASASLVFPPRIGIAQVVPATLQHVGYPAPPRMYFSNVTSWVLVPPRSFKPASDTKPAPSLSMQANYSSGLASTGCIFPPWDSKCY